MDFQDFMMAAVDLSKDMFLKYCEKAFELFFNNDIQQVDKQEFIERICMQNLKKKLVEQVILEIDDNSNESITFDEFVKIYLNYNKFIINDYIGSDHPLATAKLDEQIKFVTDSIKEILKVKMGIEDWMYWARLLKWF